MVGESGGSIRPPDLRVLIGGSSGSFLPLGSIAPATALAIPPSLAPSMHDDDDAPNLPCSCCWSCSGSCILRSTSYLLPYIAILFLPAPSRCGEGTPALPDTQMRCLSRSSLSWALESLVLYRWTRQRCYGERQASSWAWGVIAIHPPAVL